MFQVLLQTFAYLILTENLCISYYCLFILILHIRKQKHREIKIPPKTEQIIKAEPNIKFQLMLVNFFPPKS